MDISMNNFMRDRLRRLAFCAAVGLGAAIAVLAGGTFGSPLADTFIMALGIAAAFGAIILAGAGPRIAALSTAGAVVLSLAIAAVIVMAADHALAQSNLDSIVSGVEAKGNEAVSAIRKIAVLILNLVFLALGIAAMMKKISWAWAGLAVVGAILVNFSDKFSSWLGNFGGGLGLPGLPGI